MISITAMGFISEKPQLQVIGQGKQKVEFDVVWSRRHFAGGEWKTAWERVTFVAWNEEAERIATSLEKGYEVSCTGTQETSEWTDRESGTKRYRTRYRLTAWFKNHRPASRQGGSETNHDGSTGSQGQSSQPRRTPTSPSPSHREEGYGDDGHHPMQAGFTSQSRSVNAAANEMRRSPDFIDM